MSREQAVALRAELARMGYHLDCEPLLKTSRVPTSEEHASIMATLADMKGAGVDYVPLFLRFPDHVPAGSNYFARRIIGYLGQRARVFPDGQALEDGRIVPRWLFELEDFGADPVSQMQDESLWQRAQRWLGSRDSDTHVEWTQLRCISSDALDAALCNWMRQQLYAQSSIPEVLHADLGRVISHFGVAAIDFEQVTIEENRAFLTAQLWRDDPESLRSLKLRATGWLRMFAVLTGGDVSLAEPVRHPKFTRAQRRLLVTCLAEAPNLAEDLDRYRGLWLQIARSLHVGEFARRFPQLAETFARLRAGRAQSFAGRTQVLFVARDLDALLDHLATRPGEFRRCLHRLLINFVGSSGPVLDRFSSLAQGLTTKHLVTLKAHFAVANRREHRAVINKRGKIVVLDNPHRGRLAESIVDRVAALLDEALYLRLARKESWSGKRVFIEPRLGQFPLALQARKASDGLLNYTRGARIDVDLSKVLRLFVYWKQSQRRTDLDLSVMQFDATFAYRGHVSYTNLESQGIVHSGDVQSAPHGAAEFIDITLSAVPKGVRYLAVQVNRYAGESFKEMTCHAGWMVREKVSQDHMKFDARTVAHKFDLSGTGGYCVPILVDIVAGQIVFTDLYVGRKQLFNAVEGSLGSVSAIARELASFVQTRPNYYDFALMHVEARGGTLIEDVGAEYDLRFGVDEGDYTAAYAAKVLNELF